MQRPIGLPKGAFVAVALGFASVTGLGLWRLLDEREALLRTAMLERQETVGRAAAALTASVERCWRQAREGEQALPEQCTGIADDASAFRWLVISASAPRASASATATSTMRELLAQCRTETGSATFEGCKKAAVVLAEIGGPAELESEGWDLLDRVGVAAEAASEYRHLSYRLLSQSFANAMGELSKAVDDALASSRRGWVRAGRFLVTRPCEASTPCSTTIGLDIEPSPESLARFVNAANVTGGTRYQLTLVSEEQARSLPDSVSSAALSNALGYLSARDKAPPAGLGNIHLLLGAYSAAVLLLLSALVTALFLLERTARELHQRQNFVASVSHELRTPLGSMRLMLETLLGGRVSQRERQTEYLASMHREVVRLSRLAENMLVLQRLERGQRPRLEPCSLNDIVRTAVEGLREDAARHQVSLTLNLGKVPLELAAAPELLSVAFQNLVHNAIKYSPSGGRVVVSIEKTEDRVELHIEDQGRGIPAGERERVFAWFYRIGDELTRQAEGTGVGLPVVRAIARLHGAEVQFVGPDSPGAHAVFSFPLPPDREVAP